MYMQKCRNIGLSAIVQQQASKQKRNLKVDLGKCVQMYRAPFLYLPGAPNSLNPPIILEEDADNLTELMPEECTSSHDKKQLAFKVFYAQFDLMKVTIPITLSLYPITLMDKNY